MGVCVLLTRDMPLQGYNFFLTLLALLLPLSVFLRLVAIRPSNPSRKVRSQGSHGGCSAPGLSCPLLSLTAG